MNTGKMRLIGALVSLGVGVAGAQVVDDFDPGYDSAIWESFSGTVAANTNAQAGGSAPTGNHLWFGGNGNEDRSAITVPLDTTSAEIVSFQIAFALGTGPDWTGGSVYQSQAVLQYSIDGENFLTIGAPIPMLGNWTRVERRLPPEAKTLSTRLRILQLNSQLLSTHELAMDDLYIGPVSDAPVITSSLTVVRYSVPLTQYAIGATNLPDSFGASDLPPGLSIDTESGEISGTATAGSYTVTVSATNSVGTTSGTLNLTVADPQTGIADDFDPSHDPQVWAHLGGSIHANAAAQSAGIESGTGTLGNSLWFGGGQERLAVTVPVDTRLGGLIDFDIAGSNGSSVMWMPSPERAYAILEFSVDGVLFSTLWEQIQTEPHWNAISLEIPAAAKSAGTIFRFREHLFEQSFSPQMAIDNFSVAAGTSLPQITSQLVAVTPTASYQITASADPISFGATGVPMGLSVDPATGLIGGIAERGTYQVTIFATNVEGTTSEDLTWTIEGFVLEDFEGGFVPDLWSEFSSQVGIRPGEGTWLGNQVLAFFGRGHRATTAHLDARVESPITFEMLPKLNASRNHVFGEISCLYSIDDGESWILIDELTAGDWAVSWDYSPRTLTLQIPPAAKTARTMFRFSRASQDFFDIDDVLLPPLALPEITSPDEVEVFAAGLDLVDHQLVAFGATSFSILGLPDGLVFDPATTRITGKILDGVGTYPISITASNSSGSTGQTLTVTVTAVLPLIETDFEGGADPDHWIEFVSRAEVNTIGHAAEGASGDSLWFGSGGSAMTKVIDTSGGGILSFRVAFGDALGPENWKYYSCFCVSVIYSTDGGQSYSALPEQYGSTAWEPQLWRLPPGALSPGTIFKFRYGGANAAIDDLYIGPATEAPVIISPQQVDAAAGQPFHYKVETTEPPATITALVALPGGLEFVQPYGFGDGGWTVELLPDALPDLAGQAPLVPGVYIVPLLVSNEAGGTQLDLTLNVGPPASHVVDGFDPQFDPAMWEEFSGAGGIYRPNFGVGLAGKSLYFAGVNRYAVTRPFDLRNGGTVGFKIAHDGISSPSFPRDTVLEFSAGGAAFIQMAGPFDNTTWQEMEFELPQDARSSSTRFRFRQLIATGTLHGAWALEDLEIEPFVGAARLLFAGAPLGPGTALGGGGHFGGLAHGEVRSRVFELENAGDRALDLSGLVLAGDPAFSLDLTGVPATIAPGESASILVQFSGLEGVSPTRRTTLRISDALGHTLMEERLVGIASNEPGVALLAAPSVFEFAGNSSFAISAIGIEGEIYGLEISGDLKTWQHVTNSDGDDDGYVRFVYEFGEQAERVFYRIVYPVPPQ